MLPGRNEFGRVAAIKLEWVADSTLEYPAGFAGIRMFVEQGAVTDCHHRPRPFSALALPTCFPGSCGRPRSAARLDRRLALRCRPSPSTAVPGCGHRP